MPQFFQALGGSVEVTGHPVNQIVAQDDTVVALGDVSFSVRSTGEAGNSSWVYIWKLRDGNPTIVEASHLSRMAREPELVEAGEAGGESGEEG